MVTIKPIPITKSSINDVSIVQGQLLYCIDTLESFYDIADTSRIQLGSVVQLSTENSRTSLESPLTDKMYIVIETNVLYMYDSQWIIINTDDQCTKFLYNAEVLTPTTLIQNGIQQAPKTLASQVFFADGSNAEDMVKQFALEGKKISLICKTRHVVIDNDNQRIVDVPFPTSSYDIYKFPAVIIWNKTYMEPNTYAIGSEQLIFVDPNIATKKDDIITFIFSYAEVITNEDINAESINGVRIFTGEHEPVDKLPSDIWIDTARQEIKQYNVDGWNMVFKNNNTFVKRITNTVAVNIETDTIPIGISTFDNTKDTLIVFQNGVLLDESIEYKVSDDSQSIQSLNGSMWDISEGNNYFYFFVLKNVPAYVIGDPQTNSEVVDVAEDSRITAVEVKLDEVMKKLSMI